VRRSRADAFAVNLIDLVGNWGIYLGGLGIVVAAGWLLYGMLFTTTTFFGLDPTTQQPLAPAARAVLLARMETMLRVLAIGAVTLAAGALVRYWACYETGIFLALLGAVLFFGTPFVLTATGSSVPEPVRRLTELMVLYYTRTAGMLLLVLAGLHLLLHSIWAFASRAQRRPTPHTDVSGGKLGGRPTEWRDRFLGPCWDLPYCRDQRYHICPVRHSKQPCWRRGRGCYCDSEIVLILSGERPWERRRTAAGFVDPQSVVGTLPVDGETKREQCLGCPIYLHHQEQKYRLAAPAAVLAVIGGIALFREQIHRLYPELMLGLGRVLGSFAHDPTADVGVPRWAIEMAESSGFEWILIVIAGLLLVSYLLHAVEWALYRWGI